MTDEEIYLLCLERALLEDESHIATAIELLEWARPHSRAWQARELLLRKTYPRGTLARRQE